MLLEGRKSNILYLARNSASSFSNSADKVTPVPLCMITFWYKPLANGDRSISATLNPPADSPNMVTFLELPPKL